MLDWFRKKKNDPAEEALDNKLDEQSEESAEQELEAEAGDFEPAEDFEQQEDQAGDLLESEETAEAEDAEEPEESVVTEEESSSAQPAKKGFFSRLWGSKDEPEAAEEAAADAEAESSETAESPEEEVPEPEEAAVEEIPETAAELEEPPTGEPAEEETLAAESEVEPQEDYLEETPVAAESEAVAESEKAPEAAPGKGLLARFRDKLAATRRHLAGRIETLLSSVRSLDDDLLDELEELLISSDLGAKTSTELLFKIRGQVASKELNDVAALKEALKKSIRRMVDLPPPVMPEASPLVLMVVGINGVGKTTTIAKLTRRLTGEGKKVLLAAGDTFRSAAVEQLGIWAERLGADIVAQPTGADPSAVVFDALSAARARGSDVVIIDTAGRLHTKVNLMDELKKIKRVAGKALPGAPHHTILVLDGNTGQNAQRQAQTFHEAVGVDSIIITKLDGTAKGGVIVSIANELKIPITYVGLGESFEDLQPFDPEAFTEAILGA